MFVFLSETEEHILSLTTQLILSPFFLAADLYQCSCFITINLSSALFEGGGGNSKSHRITKAESETGWLVELMIVPQDGAGHFTVSGSWNFLACCLKIVRSVFPLATLPPHPQLKNWESLHWAVLAHCKGMCKWVGTVHRLENKFSGACYPENIIDGDL